MSGRGERGVDRRSGHSLALAATLRGLPGHFLGWLWRLEKQRAAGLGLAAVDFVAAGNVEILVTGAGEAAALVDQGGQLDPQTAVGIGVDLERLLWLRPQNLGDSLAAAELLVHTGFPLVALDLGLPPVRGRAPLAAWLRLAPTD